MVRGFSRMTVVRVDATTRDPKAEGYPRTFAFDPRESASMLSLAVMQAASRVERSELFGRE